MSNTANITAGSTSWVLVATSPTALTIKSNGPDTWHLAIKDTAGAPLDTLIGEIHQGYATWESGSVTGSVYVRSATGASFAVTV